MPLLLLGGTWVIGCTIKSSIKNVTCPNAILAMDGLTSQLPWDWVKGCGFKPPLSVWKNKTFDVRKNKVNAVSCYLST